MTRDVDAVDFAAMVETCAEDPLAVLTQGPLLPFDYVWFRGQRFGLVPVVQTQLIMRNPQLVKVDRTPLGIDPNQALFRSFLMHGDPRIPIKVFTFYERDICAGVTLDYFNLPEVKAGLDRLYASKGWVERFSFTQAATTWLSLYDQGLQALSKRLDDADLQARKELINTFAAWVFPAVHLGTREKEDDRGLTPTGRVYWEILGDFTLLSIVTAPAFCAFAWLKQTHFPNLRRSDDVTGATESIGLFKFRFLWVILILGIVGLIISIRAATSATFDTAVFLIGLVFLIAPVGFTAQNIFFWYWFTFGSPERRARIPAQYIASPKQAREWYLR